jgi:CHAD domain-containing protein
MRQTLTPVTIFRQNVDEFRAALPELLDGSPVGIHDARVATRRIREVLPLTRDWDRHQVADDLLGAFKRVGRSLGRVRDLDVRVDLLSYLEPRIGEAAAAVHVARRQQERQRLVLMRKLIKRLEGLAVDGELGRLGKTGATKDLRLRMLQRPSWPGELRRLLDERSVATWDSIDHATGVYFPNRLHQARIAIKKFRYASEIATATGILKDDGLLRDLRRTQDVLGQLHDREMLIRELDHIASQNGDVKRRQIRMIQQLAEAEIVDLHARFLARRRRVVDCCRSVQRAVQPANARVGLLVASALAVTSLAMLHRPPALPESH